MKRRPVKIIPPALRALWIRFCEQRLAIPAIRERLDLPDHGLPVGLHLVVSAHTWRMGLLALRSLEFHSGAKWSPVIHEDGSLTDSDADALVALQPDARLIRRRAADLAAETALAAHPACRTHRTRHNWFLKFFDTWLQAAHEHYIVLDSDVVFFRNPHRLRDWAATHAPTLHFMRDTRETYASPRQELERILGMPLWESVNSGICLMLRRAVSLDLAEVFLERIAPTARHYKFLEQTLFALTGSAWGRGGCLGPEYEISWNNFRRRDAVCRHYVGPFKDDLLWVEGAASFWRDRRLGRRRA